MLLHLCCSQHEKTAGMQQMHLFFFPGTMIKEIFSIKDVDFTVYGFLSDFWKDMVPTSFLN